MKKVTLIFSIIPLISFSQLKVKDNGIVQVGTSSSWSSGNPDLEIGSSSNDVLVNAYAASSSKASFWATNANYAYGFGIDASSTGYIYRNIVNKTPIMYFKNTGYVGIGESNPLGNLHVKDYFYLSSGSSIFRFRSVNGYTQIGSSVDEIDFWYTGISYHQLHANNFYAAQTGTNYSKSSSSSFNEKLLKNMNNLNLALHYPKGDSGDKTNMLFGFSSKEIEENFPNLIIERNNEKLINFDSFIPLLIEANKNQQNEIDDLNNEIEDLKSEIEEIKDAIKSGNFDNLDNGEDAYLEQNSPNPFKNITKISYFIPDNMTGSSQIIIHDMSGSEILSKSINSYGNGNIEISGSNLSPGMYTYTLLIDGKIIDTKKMILTKD